MLEQTEGPYLVIAFFDDQATGSVVARALSARRESALEGRHIGLLTLIPGGATDRSRLGQVMVDGHVEVGAILRVVADAIDGGVLPQRRHFLDQESELLTDDVARIGAELEGGRSAVALLGGVHSAEEAIVAFTELGGRTEVHRISVAATEMVSGSPVERRIS